MSFHKNPPTSALAHSIQLLPFFEGIKKSTLEISILEYNQFKGTRLDTIQNNL